MQELIKSTTKDENILKYSTISISSWNMLKYKINDILDYSMLETGSWVIKIEEFNLRELMIEIHEMILLQFDPKLITFRVYVSNLVPLTVFHDSQRVKQILLNLICNALKYTEKGFVTVLVDWVYPKLSRTTSFSRFTRKCYKIWNLHFAVSDSGCGIEKVKRMNLFKMFSEAQITENQDVNASSKLMGIGLAFWYNMLKKMNSKLELTSAINYGSTFSFKIDVEYLTDNNTTSMPIRLASNHEIVFQK